MTSLGVCLEAALRADLARASVIWITVSEVFVVVVGENQCGEIILSGEVSSGPIH